MPPPSGGCAAAAAAAAATACLRGMPENTRPNQASREGPTAGVRWHCKLRVPRPASLVRGLRRL
eukprot:scaffold29791_cov52-Phaeocystis_antarctica.AAC.2